MEVYKAINAIQKALAKEGITKSKKNQQQGYSFRGIDDVYNTVSSLLGEHGLCILPRMLTRQCVERQTKSGSTLFYVTLEAEFDSVSAEDGSKHTVRTFGEAMDSADKATNKAMSAAYKYAVIQAFAIPTEGDNDADATTHDVAGNAQAPVTPVAGKPKTLPTCTDDELTQKINQNLQAWKSYVTEGKKTPEGILETLASKVILTESQRGRVLLALEHAPPRFTEEQQAWVDDMERVAA